MQQPKQDMVSVDVQRKLSSMYDRLNKLEQETTKFMQVIKPELQALKADLSSLGGVNQPVFLPAQFAGFDFGGYAGHGQDRRHSFSGIYSRII
jgi:hypothetical protein